MRSNIGIYEKSFVRSNLRKSIKYSNIIRYENLAEESKRSESIDESLSKLSNNNAFAGGIESNKIDGAVVYTLCNSSDVPILNLLNDNIRIIYDVKLLDRDTIICNLKKILVENSKYFVMRLDIKEFFESFDRSNILKKISDDGYLSSESVNVLEQLFRECKNIGVAGLPRGLNISSTLSEIMLKDLDNVVSNNKLVYYYCRYVDDIIIVADDKAKKQEMLELIKKHLVKKLELHSRDDKFKCLIINPANKSNKQKKCDVISYLGYKFNIAYSTKNADDFFSIERRCVWIDISENKIKKIKIRLIKSFVKYLEGRNPMGKDYKDLILRLKFLTGNYNLPKSKDGIDVKSGLYYNYKHINRRDSLEELDNYFRGLLFDKKYRLSRRIIRSIPLDERREISNFSFVKGYHDKIFYKFTQDQLLEIRRAWL